MIRTILFFLCALGSVAVAQTGYPRTMYVAFDKAPMYDSADYLSPVSAELELGDSVRVIASEKKFFRIEYAGREGFVLGSNLTLAVPKRRAKKAKQNVTPAPVSQPKANAPAVSATSTQCTATTRSGSRCSRKVEAPETICWQHRK